MAWEAQSSYPYPNSIYTLSLAELSQAFSSPSTPLLFSCWPGVHVLLHRRAKDDMARNFSHDKYFFWRLINIIFATAGLINWIKEYGYIDYFLNMVIEGNGY